MATKKKQVYLIPQVRIADSRKEAKPDFTRRRKSFISETIKDIDANLPELADYQYIVIDSCSQYAAQKLASYCKKKKDVSFNYDPEKKIAYVCKGQLNW